MDHKTIIPQELTKSVQEAFGSVFESPRPVNEVPELLDGIFSTIYLKGDIVGKISMFIRTSNAAQVVANMLGVEELQPESLDTLDGVGEILNMTAGCFKKYLEPHKLKFEISVPSTRLVSLQPPGRWENNVEQVFSSSGFLFKVILSYRIATKEDKASPPQSAQAKIKFSAAELLKAALAKKKQ